MASSYPFKTGRKNKSVTGFSKNVQNVPHTASEKKDKAHLVSKLNTLPLLPNTSPKRKTTRKKTTAALEMTKDFKRDLTAESKAGVDRFLLEHKQRQLPVISVPPSSHQSKTRASVSACHQVPQIPFEGKRNGVHQSLLEEYEKMPPSFDSARLKQDFCDFPRTLPTKRFKSRLPNISQNPVNSSRARLKREEPAENPREENRLLRRQQMSKRSLRDASS